MTSEDSRATGGVDLVHLEPRPQAPATLVCLPYAGGGASLYRAWAARMDGRVEVVAARLPGRESRICEPPAVSPQALADAVTATVDRPYAFYGHSMGARLAFEATRLLRDQGARTPQRLFLGGCKAPHLTSRGALEGVSGLPDADLVQTMRSSGSMPAEIAAFPELLEIVLPALRADLQWCDGYRYQPGPPVGMPITAFAGRDDPTMSVEDMLQWERHTNADFDLRVLPGDHFFLHDNVAELCDCVADHLIAAVDQPAGGIRR